MAVFQSSCLKFVAAGISLFASASAGSEEVLVRTPCGDSITIDIDSEETFASVVKKIEANIKGLDYDSGDIEGSRTFVIDYLASGIHNVRASTNPFEEEKREYNRETTDEEKKDLRYILKSLASKTWSELLKSKSSLNRAGDRIDDLHPLRFLICIFTDEELKGCVHSIRDSKKIWDNFFEGLESSLKEEAQRSNMKPEFVQDFANILGINVSSVSDIIANRQWEKLVDTLLKLLPRKGNPGRYDM